jgi:hypothetical protein
MANVNATWLYKTGLLTIKGTSTGPSVNDLIGLTTPETILSVLNTIAYGDSKKIMMEIGSFNANVVNYGNFYKYQLGYSNSSNGNDGKFIIQGCPVSTSTYTNTDPPVTLLQLSKTNLGLSVPIQFQVNTWNTSSDGKTRFFFSSSNRTYFGSPNGYSFRNETDALDIVIIDTIGNILIGSNIHSMESGTFPTPPIPKIYSGTDSFNSDGGKYHTALSLGLEAQSIVDPVGSGGKAYGASIILEGGREAALAPQFMRVDGTIKFTTGGSERLRVTNDGLYIFSGNVPIRLQTRYIDAAPGYDCMFEINTNYNRLTNTVDSPFYGTASLQVNSSQSEGGYISMATGGKNIAPTEVVRVAGSNMNVAGNITVTGGIFTGNGSGLTNLPNSSSVNISYAELVGIELFGRAGTTYVSPTVKDTPTNFNRTNNISYSLTYIQGGNHYYNTGSSQQAVAQAVYSISFTPRNPSSTRFIIEITYSAFIRNGSGVDAIYLYLITGGSPLLDRSDGRGGYFNTNPVLDYDYYALYNNASDIIDRNDRSRDFEFFGRPEVTLMDKFRLYRGYVKAAVNTYGTYDFVVSNACVGGVDDFFGVSGGPGGFLVTITEFRV